MSLDLKQIIKALLFSTSEPLSAGDLFKVYTAHREELLKQSEAETEEEEVIVPEELKKNQIEAAIQELKSDLEATSDVYRVIEEPTGYRLAVSPEYSVFVRILRSDERPLKLSSAAMETLALVAYRQPVTRAEMESIRGVAVDSAIGKLMDLGLVTVKGHASLPGKPRLYVTTDEFLKFCGITSLADLPASDIVSPEKISEWVKQADKSQGYDDADVGLSHEDSEEPPEGESSQSSRTQND